MDLTDPRQESRRNHNRLGMVALALCGTIAEANADIERIRAGHRDLMVRIGCRWGLVVTQGREFIANSSVRTIQRQ